MRLCRFSRKYLLTICKIGKSGTADELAVDFNGCPFHVSAAAENRGPAHRRTMITRHKFEGAEGFAAMLREVGGDVVQYGGPDPSITDQKWKEWSCTMAPLSSGAVMHFTSAGPIAGTGTTDADKVVLLMPWMDKVPHYYRGVEMSPRGAAIYGPNSEHVGKCDADHAFTVFLVNSERLREHLRHVLRHDAAPPDGVFWPMDLTEELRGELESIVTDILAAADKEGGAFDDENIRLAYEQRVLSVITDMIALKEDRRLEEMPRHEQRTKLVNTCWNLARREENRNLTIEDLCMETHASVRALRYAFQEMAGHSPAVFLRNHRLHKARRMLLDTAGAVKEAAYSCGFTEMGRFSIYYRELFGESPSETLKSRLAR